MKTKNILALSIFLNAYYVTLIASAINLNNRPLETNNSVCGSQNFCCVNTVLYDSGYQKPVKNTSFSTTLSSDYEYISHVSIGTIDQASLIVSNGYQDFTSQITTMHIGVFESITIGITNPKATNQIKIWVDWNKNGDFDDNYENVYSSVGINGNQVSTSFAPPEGSILDSTRMRIRLYNTGVGPNSTSCGNSDFGEVEDYTIIVEDIPCTPVSIITPTVDTIDVCVPLDYMSINVNANGTNPITYQWQYNNYGDWVNVVNNLPTGALYFNETTFSLGVSGISSTSLFEYRCLLTNCNGINSDTSASVFLNSNALPATAGTINGPAFVSQGQDLVSYSVPGIANAVSYNWAYSGYGATITNVSNNIIAISFSAGATSGNLSVSGANLCGNGLASVLNIEVEWQKKVKLFLEGLYNITTHQMNKAQDENGDHFSGEISEKIEIEFHNSVSPFELVYAIQDLVLKKDGTCTFTLPSNLQSSYYIVIRHRNHIETWSSIPVSVTGISALYDFTDSNLKAYGGNLKLCAPNIYSLFAGDSNHDGAINSLDLILIENNSPSFLMGYVDSDVNGDGVVDALDLIMTDNNSAKFIVVKKP